MDQYEFRASINLNTKNDGVTGHVAIFDAVNKKFVCTVPVQARDQKRFMEIAKSIKKAFLGESDK